MTGRFFTLLLIPAIIGCPLMCVAGSCASSGLEAEPAVAACCCCPHSGQPPQNEGDRPIRPDSGGPCQGVCGGVVFVKPVETHRLQECDLFQFVAVENAVVAQPAVTLTDVERGLPLNGLPAGRSLRALHMSFLC